jgi:chromosome segregation ATPase
VKLKLAEMETKYDEQNNLYSDSLRKGLDYQQRNTQLKDHIEQLTRDNEHYQKTSQALEQSLSTAREQLSQYMRINEEQSVQLHAKNIAYNELSKELHDTMEKAYVEKRDLQNKVNNLDEAYAMMQAECKDLLQQRKTMEVNRSSTYFVIYLMCPYQTKDTSPGESGRVRKGSRRASAVGVFGNELVPKRNNRSGACCDP